MKTKYLLTYILTYTIFSLFLFGCNVPTCSETDNNICINDEKYTFIQADEEYSTYSKSSNITKPIYSVIYEDDNNIYYIYGSIQLSDYVILYNHENYNLHEAISVLNLTDYELNELGIQIHKITRTEFLDLIDLH